MAKKAVAKKVEMKKAPDMAVHQAYMKSRGISMIILGILVILNQMYAVFEWPMFIAWLLILLGLKNLLHLGCSTCKK